MSDLATHLVFKGGTSLSKAWKLIHRFLEDVDLAIDKEFFITTETKWTRSKIKTLRKKAGKYSTGQFFTDLQQEFEKMHNDFVIGGSGKGSFATSVVF